MTSDGRPGEPSWAGDAARLWLDETRLFWATAIAFVRHPHRFGEEWTAGRARAMNPLGFLAVCWPILLPIDYGLQRLLGWDRRPDVNFAVDMARAARPYLFLIPTVLMLHVIFRVLGSQRRLLTTLGLLLYWMSLFTFVWVLGVAVCFVIPADSRLPQYISLTSVVWGALALSGAHRVRWWWCLLLLLVTTALALTGMNHLLERIRLT